MKKIIHVLVLLCCSASLWSQSDTLYTKTKQKITCKIIEINDSEIKYRIAVAAEEGPVYVINRIKISRYTLANGFSEVLAPDELSIENQHAAIMNNRTVVKIHPFSFVNSQFSFAYEQVIKVGTSLDVEVGYVNSNINYNYSMAGGFYNQIGGRAFYSGAYIKPGFKFFLGQDFTLKGMRYAHPLKGRYIKLDLAASFLQHRDVVRAFSTSNGQVYSTRYLSTDVNTVAYGGFVNYGRQFILGNVLTMEYYFGVGFTAVSVGYSNPDFKSAQSSNYSYNEFLNFSNYHGFMRIPGLGLSGTAGFRIGYIIPAVEPKTKPKQ